MRIPIPVNSLRTGILAQLTFLILAAMLLINVVMIKLAERDLIWTRLQAGRLLVQAVEQVVGAELSDSPKKSPDLQRNAAFATAMIRLMTEAGYAHLLIVDREGDKIFATDLSEEDERHSLSAAREAAATGMGSHHFTGTTWGVIWLSKSHLWISAPLSLEDRKSVV